MPVGDPVDEGDDDVQARFEDLVELAEALDDPGVLLRHHAHALDHEHRGERDDEKRHRERPRQVDHRDHHGRYHYANQFSEHGSSLEARYLDDRLDDRFKRGGFWKL